MEVEEKLKLRSRREGKIPEGVSKVESKKCER